MTIVPGRFSVRDWSASFGLCYRDRSTARQLRFREGTIPHRMTTEKSQEDNGIREPVWRSPAGANHPSFPAAG